MGYLISFLGLGAIVVGLFGVALANRALVITSALMLIACLALCILDTLIASYKGVKGNSTFNWVSALRFPKKLK